MTAKSGDGEFSSPESRSTEQDHVRWVDEVIKDYGVDWTIKYALPISEIIGEENNKYARKQNGKSSEYLSDGGYIYYKNNLRGVCEHKYQKEPKNAVERASRYLLFFHHYEIFISTAGPGFGEIMLERSCETAKFLEVAWHGHKRLGLDRGVTLVNNANESEFKKALRIWLNGLI